LTSLPLIALVVTVTSYRPVTWQTDDSPWTTSIGQRVSETGVAVSQDLIANGTACYGDTLVIPGFGHRVVNDTMNPRHKNHVDIWVRYPHEEAQIGWRKNVEVYVIQAENRRCRK
jgi:3D (Asp-Asp-Asp) domain-containing protein